MEKFSGTLSTLSTLPHIEMAKFHLISVTATAIADSILAKYWTLNGSTKKNGNNRSNTWLKGALEY